MKKIGSSSSNSPGLGLVGGAVAMNMCPSTDTSLFCQFSRFFQIFTMIITIVVILYFIYTLAIPYLVKKTRGGRR